ncbi:ankyrin repeat-containing domain protein [Podospora didyma]|uniref:protein S-acyltransferase n=1 Tax=Podospora didyma TaxID=330526 RepID=A0AAE0NWZ5_9PEZI|nr:ankyrin repeat-containing domain protein [Podospora didyma]
MHGEACTTRLDKTVQMIQKLQSLSASSETGMTALMQAIDFQDLDVVAALLRAEPKLASVPLISPTDLNEYNFPIHFATQISTKRDAPDALDVLRLISDYTDDLDINTVPSHDSRGRIAIYLAWMLSKRPGLLDAVDDDGRTPLHYSTNPATYQLLLTKGANVDHTDKLGRTALDKACLRGNLELVQTLLKRLPKLHISTDNPYGTPLHWKHAIPHRHKDDTLHGSCVFNSGA